MQAHKRCSKHAFITSNFNLHPGGNATVIRSVAEEESDVGPRDHDNVSHSGESMDHCCKDSDPPPKGKENMPKHDVH